MAQCQTQIHTGEVNAWCKREPEVLYHAMFCDPPYHLTSISARYKTISERDKLVTNLDPYRRTARGFMNQEWDGGDIAFQPETWAAFLPHLHPGAMLMAFAGTRGWHRMAVAIEDAGFIIHPTIFNWVYGSGFPKATRVKGDRRFDGHRYGKQAMKPACEPIIVAQVPYAGRPLDSITATGAGTFNIDEGRIGTETVKTMAGNLFPAIYGDFKECEESTRNGRWPANLILDEESAKLMDRQSGVNIGTGKAKMRMHSGRPASRCKGAESDFETLTNFGDTGGASRFFMQSNWDAEEYDPFFYCKKSGRVERDAGLEAFAIKSAGRISGGGRNAHPCVKPIKLCRYLASILSPPPEYAPRRLLIPFSGSGSEIIGACLSGGWEFVQGIEMSAEYARIAEARINFWQNNSGLFESLTDTDDMPTDAQESLF